MSHVRFDRYLAVDWSAASTPKQGEDSIWIADLADGGDVMLNNPSTRRAAERQLDSAIRQTLTAKQRLLVGVDAGLGYPRGTAQRIGLAGIPWQSMWTQISALLIDDEQNRNNRFEVAALLNRAVQERRYGRASVDGGPFWGAPNDDYVPHLRRTKPAIHVVSEFRTVEERFRAVGLFPKSEFQLFGAGSVGSQSLTVIPVIQRLIAEFGDAVEVWPFSYGVRAPAAPVVVAEIWPSQFTAAIPRQSGRIKDALQVEAVVDAFKAAAANHDLDVWFRPPLTADERDVVTHEEGWILGPPVL